MKFFFLLNLLTFLSFGSIAQIISHGESHLIYSETLNEERTYWVSLPDDYSDSTYSPYDYPVLYFLDADRHFQSVSAIAEFLAEGPYAAIPKLILVGILNTDRSRDLTPTSVTEPQFGKFVFPNTGGHGSFNQFVVDELLPTINASYRTNGFNIYMGHSFGGLSAITTLLENESPFQAYLAFDPSVWWDNRYLCDQAKELLNDTDWSKKSLYIAEAYNPKIPSDTSTEHEHAIHDFVHILDGSTTKSLRWGHEFYPNDDHGNISLPATYYGLKFVFEGYQQEVKLMFDDPEKLLNHYKLYSEKVAYEFLPAEWMLDWMATYCLKNNKPESAKIFAEMNLKIHPTSNHARKKLQEIQESIEL